MDFSAALFSKMSDIDSGTTEPFIIYRDSSGGWHCDHTQNQYGETYDWVLDAKEEDPLAAIYTGAHFSRASFPVVYDTVLYDRVCSEYQIARNSGKDDDRLHALVCFFQDRISSIADDATAYLAMLERPLSALHEMCPFDMTTDNVDWTYNEELAEYAVAQIENAARIRLHNHADNPVLAEQDKNGYTELNKVSINDSDVILSENPDAGYRYTVTENRYTSFYNKTGDNNIFTGHTNDYLEAIAVFSRKVQHNIECVQSRRDLRQRMYGVEYAELKITDCLPESNKEDFTGKLIIVKSEELIPEYRSSDYQLVICSHGNGARPGARGTSVFGEELLSGDSVCYGRHQIAGIADPEKLPVWAAKKFAVMETLEDPDVTECGGHQHKEQPLKVKLPQNKKPSLLGRLDNAKAKTAASNTERKDIRNKKKRGVEV